MTGLRTTPSTSLFASQRHLVEIASGMYDGYTADCSCGWRSREMASNRGAWGEGNRHYADYSAMALALNQRDEAQHQVTRLRDAIAEALTSLATGPMKDGYAYSLLDSALKGKEPS